MKERVTQSTNGAGALTNHVEVELGFKGRAHLPDGTVVPWWLANEVVRKKMIQAFERGRSYREVRALLASLGIHVNLTNLIVAAFKRKGVRTRANEGFVAYLRQITPSALPNPKARFSIAHIDQSRTVASTVGALYARPEARKLFADNPTLNPTSRTAAFQLYKRCGHYIETKDFRTFIRQQRKALGLSKLLPQHEVLQHYFAHNPLPSES